MTFGVYTGLVYFIKPFIEKSAEGDPLYLVWGAAFVFASFPMLFTTKSLAQALSTSTFGHFLVFDVFGIPDEKLALPLSKYGDSYSVAIFVGLVIGSISYFFSPIYVLVAIGVFVAIALIMTSPEIGVVASLALLPLFSTEKGEKALVLLVLLYTFSYFVKLLRGKRIIRFGISDLLLLIFCFFLALSGWVNVWNTDESVAFRAVFIIVGCFVAGNLMNTKIWQRRCVMALVYSGFFTSVALLWQRCVPSVNEIFGLNIDGAVIEKTMLFGNSDHLAMFLIFSLVMTMTLIYRGEGIKHRASVALMVSCIGLAIFLASSLIELLVCLAALIVFFMIISRKTITVGAFAVVTVPSVLLILNGKVLSGALAFLDLTPDPSSSMAKVWDGSFDLIRSSYFLGLGDGGFAQVYPVYANAGFEDSANAGAFYLSLLCETGILGFLLVSAVVFLFFKNGFGFLKLNVGKDKKAFIAGAVSAVSGMLIQSLFCDFFGDANLLYLLFATFCIVFSSIRTGCDEINKYKIEKVNTEYASSVEL